MELSIVEQTWETVRGEWIYRIREVQGAEWRAGRFPATMISRVPTNRPLWNHGVIKQMFDREAGKFVPASMVSRSVHFKTVDEAIAVIEQQS